MRSRRVAPMTRRARSSSSSSSVYAKTPQHLLVVLPKRRRREPVVAARTGRHPEWPTRVAVRSGDRMLDLFVESPRIELRYVIHRFGCQRLLSRNMLCVKGIDDFRRRLGPRPIGDHSRRTHRGRGAVVPPTRIARRQQIRSPHCLDHARPVGVIAHA